jgi:hypothetical protein
VSQAPEQGFWDGLGVAEGTGLPVHMPMTVTARSQGPSNYPEAHHVECWCGDSHCILNRELRMSYLLGQKASSHQLLIDGREGGFEDA